MDGYNLLKAYQVITIQMNEKEEKERSNTHERIHQEKDTWKEPDVNGGISGSKRFHSQTESQALWSPTEYDLDEDKEYIKLSNLEHIISSSVERYKDLHVQRNKKGKQTSFFPLDSACGDIERRVWMLFD